MRFLFLTITPIFRDNIFRHISQDPDINTDARLVKHNSQPQVYFQERNLKRWIINPEVFNGYHSVSGFCG